jgi:hypothetical protein
VKAGVTVNVPVTHTGSEGAFDVNTSVGFDVDDLVGRRRRHVDAGAHKGHQQEFLHPRRVEVEGHDVAADLDPLAVEACHHRRGAYPPDFAGADIQRPSGSGCVVVDGACCGAPNAPGSPVRSLKNAFGGFGGAGGTS